ncbi:hypothetical protein I350_04760 [Cryptococcus amylolentus CBS 6273]|nr:hypothetical protein I350_04760 [Cryptococcus amylolentus CBS 6273]
MANNQSGPSSSLSIRGAAAGGPASRVVANALRGAGISRSSAAQGMDIDGGVQRGPGRGAARRGRSSGPLDQTGRHRPPVNGRDDSPYAKRPTNVAKPARGRGGRHSHPGRNPAGTPPTLADLRRGGTPSKAETDHANSQLKQKLGSEEMKAWLRSRMISPGVLDMSNLQLDEWLNTNGILPPGHVRAPHNSGIVFWRLIDSVLQKTDNTPIHTLTLGSNDLHHLKQLEKLPFWLPDIRALDLSDNPINHIAELDNILASGEKKGKANAGMGSLKSLVELKLNGCAFREKTLAMQDGEAIYKHEILRRFPGLRILDGVSLERVVFPIERKPKIKHTEEQKAALVARPYTFPVEVKSEFFSEAAAKDFAMSFCARYFPLFDNARGELLPAYAPNALISIAANTLSSRSYLATQVVPRTRSERPQPVPFEPWTKLPSRNFFRNATSIQQRMETLKTRADPEKLLEWWDKSVPKTEHPLTDAGKWCFECWVLDSEGGRVRLCLQIQGMFRELPSGTYRSFSRTFILVEAPPDSPAVAAGFPATILSDTMIVHSYLGSNAFDGVQPLASHGVTIQPPSIPFSPSEVVIPAGAPAAAPGLPAVGAPSEAEQQALVAQVSQRTRMNAQFAMMCLAQNGWDLEAAVANFEEIKGSIPQEAFL